MVCPWRPGDVGDRFHDARFGEPVAGRVMRPAVECERVEGGKPGFDDGHWVSSFLMCLVVSAIGNPLSPGVVRNPRASVVIAVASERSADARARSSEHSFSL